MSEGAAGHPPRVRELHICASALLVLSTLYTGNKIQLLTGPGVCASLSVLFLILVVIKPKAHRFDLHLHRALTKRGPRELVFIRLLLPFCGLFRCRARLVAIRRW